MSEPTEFPVGIAAGMLRYAHNVEPGLLEMMSCIRYGSFTLRPCEGNPEPVFWFNSETWGSVNSVGLKNEGLQQFLDEELDSILELHEDSKCKVCVSLAPQQTGDLKAMFDMINEHPLRRYIHLIEVNGACPNHRTEEGVQPVLAYDLVAIERLLKEIPLSRERRSYRIALKIAPHTDRGILLKSVDLCLTYEIDEIVNGNTLPGSSTVDGVQRLSQPTGGHAGLPLLESAIRQSEMLMDIITRKGREDRLSVVHCGGIMDADGLRKVQQTGVHEAQLATLYYEYGARGVQNMLTEFYS